jgi:DNA anti-recombination protein RmuC
MPFGTTIEEFENRFSKNMQEAFKKMQDVIKNSNQNVQNELDKQLLSMLKALNNDCYFIKRYIQLLEEKVNC